jgi:hypothetical protein
MIPAMAGKPVWTSANVLLYTGGLTVLGGAIAALAYLSGHYGSGALTGWALLILVVLYGLAHRFKRRDRWIAAGVFAFTSVVAWGIFVALAWHWFGWLSSPGKFSSFSFARLSLELLILVAAWDDRRRFDFPFISLISALVGWFFVIDLISGGGNWTVVVTLIVGMIYVLVGVASDSPSAFWFHLVGGGLIGASLVHWWHTTDTDWALISAVALVYVGLAYATKRSTWVVYGTIGFLGATIHYLFGQGSGWPLGFSTPSISGWSPSVAFACLGFWLVLLGLMSRRHAE